MKTDNKEELLKQKNEELNNAPVKSFQRVKRVISSVVIAIVVWFLIVNVVNPQVSVTITDVPVRFVGENALRERGFVVVDKDELPNLSVKIKGTRSELINAMDRIRVDVDLSSVSREGTINVNPTVYTPDYVSLEKQRFSNIELSIEHCYEKTIPVAVDQINDTRAKENGHIVKSQPQLKEIKVTGSKADVDMADKCLVTVDAAKVDKDEELVYACMIVTKDNLELGENSSLYTSQNTIAVKNTLYKRYTVPVEVAVDSDADSKYFVSYDIRTMSQQTADIGVPEGVRAPDKLKVYIPDNDYGEGEKNVKLDIEKNDDIYVPDYDLFLKVRTQKAHKKDVVINAEVKNVPDGMYAEANNITIKATVLVTEDFEGDKVNAVIDCTGFKEGTNYGEIKFAVDNIKEFTPIEMIINLIPNDSL